MIYLKYCSLGIKGHKIKIQTPPPKKKETKNPKKTTDVSLQLMDWIKIKERMAPVLAKYKSGWLTPVLAKYKSGWLTPVLAKYKSGWLTPVLAKYKSGWLVTFYKSLLSKCTTSHHWKLLYILLYPPQTKFGGDVYRNHPVRPSVHVPCKCNSS